MSELVICRPAREDDIDAMVDLLEELFAVESDFVFDASRQRKGLQLLLACSTAQAWVAETRAQIVGMCTAQILISTAEGGKSGLLEDLVVTQAYRQYGIGKMLLAEAETWARESGLSRLQLLADHENSSALSFYKRQGWCETRMIALRKLF